ncbi:type II secretion system F family protein [Polaromonas sp. P1(28)-13]|nr:type II secretion system F family protein [Polaromonas sp. P1(28)-13]
MNAGVALFAVLAFIAVVLLFEGFFVYWNDSKSPEVRRVEQRLRAISAGGHEAGESQLLKQRVMSKSPALQKLLLQMPHAHQLDRMLQQSGSSSTVIHLITLCLLCGAAGMLGGLMLHWPWPVTVLAAAGLAALPLMRLVWKRNKRLQMIEAQLPEAMDLISRALRAGHAFPSALAMVGAEAPEPIAGEFKITSDEIGFGISIDNALNNLASRVESADMRYFVMAVIIQRETGGNLAELLGKLSELVRERFKLFAKVRVLAAEGKLSAWILTGLPFCVAGAIQLINPKYLAVLFTDPAGIRLVIGAIVLMAIGIFAMWRIIQIRV